MSTAASAIVADLRKTYPQCTPTDAYVLLNEADKKIVRAFGLRKKEYNYAVVAGQMTVDISEDILFIEAARYIDAPASDPDNVGGFLLEETNVDEMDTSGEDWRANPQGTPCKILVTHDLTTGEVGFDTRVDHSTLTVTDATNATPIVISTGTHGLADGDRADIVDVGGNLAANGNYYAKVTGYSTTTLALYEDEDLTTAVAGSGAYTSGGLVSCEDSPYLKLYTRYHATLESGSTMPLTSFYRDLYANTMRFLWAVRMEGESEVAKWKALSEDIINAQIQLTQQRGGRKPMRVRTSRARSSDYRRAGW